MTAEAEILAKLDAISQRLNMQSIKDAMPKPKTHKELVAKYQQLIRFSTIKK